MIHIQKISQIGNEAHLHSNELVSIVSGTNVAEGSSYKFMEVHRSRSNTDPSFTRNIIHSQTQNMFDMESLKGWQAAHWTLTTEFLFLTVGS